jgi:hypothetical protein
MAALFLLVAVLGAIVVGDVVLENTAVGAIRVLNHPINGYSDGLLLAMTAVLGFVVGLLAVGSVSSRRTRRARRHLAARRSGEPVYDEARRVARLRSDSDRSFPSTDDQARASRA